MNVSYDTFTLKAVNKFILGFHAVCQYSSIKEEKTAASFHLCSGQEVFMDTIQCFQQPLSFFSLQGQTVIVP